MLYQQIRQFTGFFDPRRSPESTDGPNSNQNLRFCTLTICTAFRYQHRSVEICVGLRLSSGRFISTFDLEKARSSAASSALERRRGRIWGKALAFPAEQASCRGLRGGCASATPAAHVPCGAPLVAECDVVARREARRGSSEEAWVTLQLQRLSQRPLTTPLGSRPPRAAARQRPCRPTPLAATGSVLRLKKGTR